MHQNIKRLKRSKLFHTDEAEGILLHNESDYDNNVENDIMLLVRIGEPNNKLLSKNQIAEDILLGTTSHNPLTYCWQNLRKCSGMIRKAQQRKNLKYYPRREECIKKYLKMDMAHNYLNIAGIANRFGGPELVTLNQGF